jgi:hypothetical protein
MIHIFSFAALATYTLDDTTLLQRAYVESGHPLLLMVDPPQSFIGRVDENKNAEVRQTLMKIALLIRAWEAACVLISHFRKPVGKETEVLARIIGSTAWSSTARIALSFSKHPEEPGRFLCEGAKNNLGPLASTLVYRIVSAGTVGRIEWLGEVSATTDEAASEPEKQSRGARAVAWLESLFRYKREWESEVIHSLAYQAGISRNALFSEEVKALPIKRRKRKRLGDSGEDFWVWVAMTGWPPDPRDSWDSWNSSNGSPFQDGDIQQSHCEEPDGILRNSGFLGKANLTSESQESRQATSYRDSSIPETTQGFRFQESQESQESRGMDGPNSATDRFPKPDGWPGDWRVFDGEGRSPS